MNCTKTGAKMAISCPIPLEIPDKMAAYLGDRSRWFTICPEVTAEEAVFKAINTEAIGTVLSK